MFRIHGSGRTAHGIHRVVFGPVFARLGRMTQERPILTRWILGGPVVLAVSLLFTMALAVVLPTGSADVDNIVWPLVLAPIFWALLFIYACLEENLKRGGAILGMIGILSGILVGAGLAG